MASRKAFLVGHRNRRGTLVLYLRRPGLPLVLGPWTLTAVVSAN